MKREKISSDQVTGGCITQVGGYSESAFVELIPQHVVGELIHRGNHKNAQNQHNGGIRAANLPLEANTARFLIHFVSLVNSVQSFECGDFRNAVLSKPAFILLCKNLTFINRPLRVRFRQSEPVSCQTVEQR